VTLFISALLYVSSMTALVCSHSRSHRPDAIDELGVRSPHKLAVSAFCAVVCDRPVDILCDRLEEVVSRVRRIPANLAGVDGLGAGIGTEVGGLGRELA
jgi:hypothetical protein